MGVKNKWVAFWWNIYLELNPFCAYLFFKHEYISTYYNICYTNMALGPIYPISNYYGCLYPAGDTNSRTLRPSRVEYKYKNLEHWQSDYTLKIDHPMLLLRFPSMIREYTLFYNNTHRQTKNIAKRSNTTQCEVFNVKSWHWKYWIDTAAYFTAISILDVLIWLAASSTTSNT